jgi:hypothetical protein
VELPLSNYVISFLLNTVCIMGQCTSKSSQEKSCDFASSEKDNLQSDLVEEEDQMSPEEVKGRKLVEKRRGSVQVRIFSIKMSDLRKTSV